VVAVSFLWQRCTFVVRSEAIDSLSGSRVGIVAKTGHELHREKFLRLPSSSLVSC